MGYDMGVMVVIGLATAFLGMETVKFGVLGEIGVIGTIVDMLTFKL